MSLDPSLARLQLQEAGRYLLNHQLTWGNAGNLSARVDGDRCLISASGTRLGELSNDDFVEAGLFSFPAETFTRRPSKELPMHRAIYQARPEVNAVLHSAPFYSTLVSSADLDLPADWFVEDMYYLERLARVPYHHPGTQALADAVRQAAPRANVLLLENHGVLVYDTTVAEALMGLHVLEIVARMAVTARQAGLSMRPVPAEAVTDFLERSGYRPRREWPVLSEDGLSEGTLSEGILTEDTLSKDSTPDAGPMRGQNDRN